LDSSFCKFNHHYATLGRAQEFREHAQITVNLFSDLLSLAAQYNIKVFFSTKWHHLRIGLSSMQGWRIEMEDAHTALANLQGDLKVFFLM